MRCLTKTASVVAATLLWTTAAVAEPTPAQSCQAGKNKLAGSYAGCRHRAEAKLASTGDAAAYNDAIGFCAARFDAKWPVLEQQAINRGGTCPSGGDRSAVKTVIDAHTSNVATELAGGPLQHCPTDLAACFSNLGICEAAQQGENLKTGQTNCYDGPGATILCAGTGQDGEFQAGLAHAHVDNGDGTITDTRTGLMWEKLSDDGSIHDKDTHYSWSDAYAIKIATLNSTSFAGYNDWRLPNINELQSLVNYDFVPSVDAAFNTGCVPACDVTTCSCTSSASDYTWSSTSSQRNRSFAWFVGFFNGSVNAFTKNINGYARGVRRGL